MGISYEICEDQDCQDKKDVSFDVTHNNADSEDPGYKDQKHCW